MVFQTFLVHEFFFFLFPQRDFYFCSLPPPITFLMVRPLAEDPFGYLPRFMDLPTTTQSASPLVE
jgi:hypothetical protein